MDKKEAKGLTSDVLIADALIRIKTIEKLLVAKNVFTQEEYQQQMREITDLLSRTILEKAGIPGNLDEIIKELRDKIPTQN